MVEEATRLRSRSDGSREALSDVGFLIDHFSSRLSCGERLAIVNRFIWHVVLYRGGLCALGLSQLGLLFWMLSSLEPPRVTSWTGGMPFALATFFMGIALFFSIALVLHVLLPPAAVGIMAGLDEDGPSSREIFAPWGSHQHSETDELAEESLVERERTRSVDTATPNHRASLKRTFTARLGLTHASGGSSTGGVGGDGGGAAGAAGDCGDGVHRVAPSCSSTRASALIAISRLFRLGGGSSRSSSRSDPRVGRSAASASSAAGAVPAPVAPDEPQPPLDHIEQSGLAMQQFYEAMRRHGGVHHLTSAVQMRLTWLRAQPGWQVRDGH